MAAAMKKLRIKFEGLIDELEVHYAAYLEINANDSSTYDIDNLILRLDMIRPLLNNIKDVHFNIKISCEIDNPELPGLKCEIASFTEKYLKIMTLFSKLVKANQIEPASPSVGMSQENNNYNIKLPNIQLPTFNGELSGWSNFRSMYKSLVHDCSQLDNIRKFHYLNSSLKGDALRVIHSLEITNENYSIAWQLLEKRYENKKLIILHHLKSFADTPAMSAESSVKLRGAIDHMSKHIRSLRTLVPAENCWDILTIFMAMSKLDINTQAEWHKSPEGNKDYPTFESFLEFLAVRAQLLENITGNTKALAKVNVRAALPATVSAKCIVCTGAHVIYRCPKLLKLTTSLRRQEVSKNRLCHNCLKKGHFSNDCTSSYRCGKCQQKHSILLHEDSEPEVDSNSPNTSVALTGHTKNAATVLATVLVNVPNKQGELVTLRALLDSGSQNSFITEYQAKALNLPTTQVNISVTGVGKSKTNVKRAIKLKIKSRHTAYSADVRCLIMSHITDSLPSESLEFSNLKLPKNVHLADPQFYKVHKVDMLLGADIFWHLLKLGRIDLGKYKPTIQKTTLGWVVINAPNTIDNNSSNCYLAQEQETLSDQLQRFWELENVSAQDLRSDEEIACESHFLKTFSRERDGRFKITIPFKRATSELGESLAASTKRLISLERKLEKDSELKHSYHHFMKEYIDLGHMTLSKDQKLSEPSYFLPHHGILKPDSTSTKLRVVFDGSMPTSTGLSLNCIQAVGPTIQSDLTKLLVNFRQHRYVAKADISKMYRQILVQEDQRNLQQIVWRFRQNDPILKYKLNTITYGTAAASFLAIRCLSQLGYEHKFIDSTASKAILNDFYVDDLLTGSPTIEELSSKCQKISDILETGGFKLCKWVSNTASLALKSDQSMNQSNVVLCDSEYSKTLGIRWCPESDLIQYAINQGDLHKHPTKRIILSFVAKIFDPLGLMTPCIMLLKILLQVLWSQKLEWDAPVPQDAAKHLHLITNNLHIINKLQIPRCTLIENHITKQLHGFSDASQKAYGACLYIRSTDSFGNVQTTLLCSKSRVAPLKTISIPRLAALLFARLVIKITNSLEYKNVSTYSWTDSTIVLSWLKLSPSTLKVFVANRISEIQGYMTSGHQWRHVPTNSNPADLISRGITPQEIINNKLWWSGPVYLTQSEEFWPANDYNLDNIPDKRKCIIFSALSTTNNVDIFNLHSNLNKLKRIVAYCLRFKNNCQNPATKVTGPVLVTELQSAMNALIRLSQVDHFQTELLSLIKKGHVKADSRILSLSPFLDEHKIIRVGGRLKHSDLDFDKKHPIILSSKHKLAYMIMQQEHKRLLHAGPQALLFSVRNQFWPIGGTALAKRVVHSCLICFKHRPKLLEPPMGDLPAERTILEHAFRIVGVDYAGPILIKNKLGRGSILTKAYICLFICFATKAVHIELATDLTTNNFLAVLHRFVSRRGKPSEIHSDNGTNFVGANNQLGKFLRNKSNETELVGSLANEGIKWKFIPPRAAHFGGLWESNIKSVKHHLKRALGLSHFTYEDVNTILIQIEAILNSRPMFPMSSDPEDLLPLTPGHFLVGRALTAVPEPDLLYTRMNNLLRFDLVQQVSQQFWKRWSQDYLNCLQQRNKWNQSSENVPDIGDLVLIKEDHVPPLQWQMGRIQHLIKGADDVCRVVMIKTASGIIKRAVRKLAKLPKVV